MYGISDILSHYQHFNPNEMQCIIDLLKLAGCFEPEQLRRDLTDAGFTEDEVDFLLTVQTDQVLSLVPTDATCLQKTHQWFQLVIQRCFINPAAWADPQAKFVSSLLLANLAPHPGVPQKAEYTMVLILGNSDDLLAKQFELAIKLIHSKQIDLKNKTLYLLPETAMPHEHYQHLYRSMIGNVSLPPLKVLSQREFNYLLLNDRKFINPMDKMATSGKQGPLAMLYTASNECIKPPVLMIANEDMGNFLHSITEKMKASALEFETLIPDHEIIRKMGRHFNHQASAVTLQLMKNDPVAMPETNNAPDRQSSPEMHSSTWASFAKKAITVSAVCAGFFYAAKNPGKVVDATATLRTTFNKWMNR